MDPISVFKRAIDQTGRIVSGVKPSQLGDPTPCAEWDVAGLLNHTITVVRAFDGGVRGREFDATLFEGDNVGADAGASYAAAASKLHDAVDQPGAIDATWLMPFGAVPGAQAAAFATLELAQHVCDVAKATGQNVDFDP